MKKSFIVQIFMLLVCSATYALEMPKRKGPTDFPKDTFNIFIGSGQKGVLSAFLADSDLRSNINQLSFFQATPRDISARYFIGNYTDNSLEYIPICFFDYRVGLCNKTKPRRASNNVVLQPQKSTEIPLKFEKLGFGAHDFTIVLLDTKNPSLKQSHRGIIYVGGSNFKSGESMALPQISDERKYSEVTLNYSIDPLNFERGDTIHLGEKLYFHLRNGENTKVTYAVLLIAFERIAGASEMLGKARMITLDSKQSIVLPVEATTLNNVIALAIQNPYSQLEVDSKLVQEPREILNSNILSIKD